MVKKKSNNWVLTIPLPETAFGLWFVIMVLAFLAVCAHVGLYVLVAKAFG